MNPLFVVKNKLNNPHLFDQAKLGFIYSLPNVTKSINTPNCNGFADTNLQVAL